MSATLAMFTRSGRLVDDASVQYPARNTRNWVPWMSESQNPSAYPDPYDYAATKAVTRGPIGVISRDQFLGHFETTPNPLLPYQPSLTLDPHRDVFRKPVCGQFIRPPPSASETHLIP